MNVAIITAVHQRPRVWQLWLRYNLPIFKELSDHKFVLFVAGNEEFHKAQLKADCTHYQIDFDWIESENNPVGDKFNRACKAVKKWEHLSKTTIDYACIVGSDDLISKEYWVSALSNERANIIGTNQAAIIRIDFEKPEILPDQVVFQNTPEAAFNENQTPLLGSGRILSRKVLKEINWILFDSVNSGLDTSLDKRLLALNYSFWLIPLALHNGVFIVVLKHDANINGWGFFKHLPILEFPNQELKKIERLIQLSHGFFE